jgi:hypothetical protein
MQGKNKNYLLQFPTGMGQGPRFAGRAVRFSGRTEAEFA